MHIEIMSWFCSGRVNKNTVRHRTFTFLQNDKTVGKYKENENQE